MVSWAYYEETMHDDGDWPCETVRSDNNGLAGRASMALGHIFTVAAGLGGVALAATAGQILATGRLPGGGVASVSDLFTTIVAGAIGVALALTPAVRYFYHPKDGPSLENFSIDD